MLVIAAFRSGLKWVDEEHATARAKPSRPSHIVIDRKHITQRRQKKADFTVVFRDIHSVGPEVLVSFAQRGLCKE